MSPLTPRAQLERVLREVRAQRPPEPREEALPARLRAELRSLGAQPRSAQRPVRSSHSRAWQLGAAAALAAAGLWLVLRPAAPEGAVSPEHAPLEQAALGGTGGPVPATVDGQPLAAGVLLEATSVARVVQHEGRASWVLQPGSRASLRSAAHVLQVDLEQGSLTAQVRPGEQPESFVVRARGTEVAVHGTRFSVSLLPGERVRVEVSDGIVQVRPSGQSAGIALSERGRGEFVAGVLQPEPEPRRGLTAPRAESGNGTRPAPGGPPPDPPPAPAQRPPAVAVRPPPPAEPPGDAASERAIQAVTEHVRACFRRHLPGSRELGIEVSTRLALWVEASGQLLRADFEPPLAPDIERCVSEALVQFRAASSAEGYRVERELVLQP